MRAGDVRHPFQNRDPVPRRETSGVCPPIPWRSMAAHASIFAPVSRICFDLLERREALCPAQEITRVNRLASSSKPCPVAARFQQLSNATFAGRGSLRRGALLPHIVREVPALGRAVSMATPANRSIRAGRKRDAGKAILIGLRGTRSVISRLTNFNTLDVPTESWKSPDLIGGLAAMYSAD